MTADKLQGIVGKTIAIVKECDTNDIVIRFTDDTVFVINTYSAWDSASFDYPEPNRDHLLTVGSISQDEHDRQVAEETARCTAAREAAERQKFEELSKKFAGK